MGNFASLTAQLNLNIANFASNMQRATQQANKFASNLQGQINTGLVDPTKKAKFEFKDVSRIVQGIIISKVFYSSLNAIRSATDSVIQFSQELEYAKMVYTNLFGNANLAQNFINVLKDFAAVTPFSFEQSEAAAKRLLAYGIQYRNVMYVMRGVLAAATVQGNDQAIESISRALGQIYTKGVLKAEEMRQLAEAGIPAYEILQEKLGLTADQIGRIGDQAIPARVAINALVEGINERFGKVLDQASSTTKGLISNIKDVALMLGAGIVEPFTNNLHDMFADIESFLSATYKVFETAGLGGIFERLVPPELRESLRYLIINLKNLWSIIKSIAGSIGKALTEPFKVLVQVLNVFLPVLNMVLGTLAAVLKAVTSNAKLMRTLSVAILAAASMWAIYRIQAMAAAVATVVIKGIIAAIKLLVVAMNFVVAHPIWATLAVAVGLLVALTGASDKFAASMRKVLNSFTALGGVDPSKILLPETKERASDLDKFNNALGSTSDQMDALAASTSAAAKAAKSLLGFDEVFKLSETTDETDWDAALDLGNITTPDFSDALPVWNETDFEEISQGFVDNLLDSLGGKKALLSAGIGNILGAVLGGLIGGPLGAKIGSILGTLAGWFWPKVAEALGLTDVGTVALPIATVIGAAIGFIAGGPLGALIGGAIGSLIGWIIDKFTLGFETGNWSDLAVPLSTGIGAAIGFIAGGPLGAAIGAAIGALVGWIIDKFVENFDGIKELGSAIYEDITGWFDNLNVSIPVLLEALKLSIIAWAADLMTKVGVWFTGLKLAVAAHVTEMLANVSMKLEASKVALVVWFNDTLSKIKLWFTGVKLLLADKASELLNIFNTWIENVRLALAAWFNTISKSITNWISTVKLAIAAWFNTLLTIVVDGLKSIWDKISSWFSDLWSNIWESLSDISDKVSSWWNSLLGDKSASISIDSNLSGFSGFNVTGGHKLGGIFDKEHVANFAEDNKAEAVIPLENASAMQPFVDAISNGLSASLMPLLATMSSSSSDNLRPLYVGTLVADERGLKELNRKMQVIQVQENARRGLANA